MLKNKKITINYLVVVFACLFCLAGVGVGHATLVVAGVDQYSLLGAGNGKGDGLDSLVNVDWLLDEYYQRDVNVFSIGKFEEELIDGVAQGSLIPVGFSSPWNPDWFTWDGNILDATEGIGHIDIPSDSTFNWMGHFWYSIKAGSGFGLYDGGLMTLIAGVSYDIDVPWDIDSPPANFTTNGLSHFSLWAEASPVPEPATVLLLGVGLVGIAGLRFRRKIR